MGLCRTRPLRWKLGGRATENHRNRPECPVFFWRQKRKRRREFDDRGLTSCFFMRHYNPFDPGPENPQKLEGPGTENGDVEGQAAPIPNRLEAARLGLETGPY